MELQGIAAIITGASGRLGRFIAKALGQAGCNCICHYYHNKEKAEELVGQIQKRGVKALAIEADLTKPEQIGGLFEQAICLGTPQILINSAGLFWRQPLPQLSFQQTQEILSLNLIAPILTSQTFAKLIKDRFGDTKSVVGKIINIADVGGIRPWAEYVAYCSSKAGLIGATKALAKELAPSICVNAIAPGTVTWPDDFDETEKKQQLALIPLKRIAEPDEVTKAIMFLLENDYITGQVLNIDGGRCM